MATEKQIEANRRNALKSTGPRTAAGKAISCRNALKSGIHAEFDIVAGEDPQTQAAFIRSFRDAYRPRTFSENRLVDRLAAAEWQLRRLSRIEASIFGDDSGDDSALAATFIRNLTLLTRLYARRQRASRVHHDALERWLAVRPPRA